MGNGSSKPEQHVFNADAPVRFSQSVLDSLQKSPETDSTRAQDTELKIQTRVNAELQRIRDAQEQQLTSQLASLTTNPPTASSPASSPSSQIRGSHDPNSLAAHLSSPFYQDHKAASGPAAQPTRQTEHTHDSVQKEVMALQQKLASRRKIEKATPAVEEAKEKLVGCLRTNDRRPLDCWQEVETFKREVSKMERAFVERVSR